MWLDPIINVIAEDVLNKCHTEHREEDGNAEKWLLGQVGGELGVSSSPRLEDTKWYKDCYVDVQELVIGEVASFEVEQRDREKLD